MSDNLMDPKVYVAGIVESPTGAVWWFIRFVDSPIKVADWHKTKSVRTARKAIKAAVRARKQKSGKG